MTSTPASSDAATAVWGLLITRDPEHAAPLIAMFEDVRLVRPEDAARELLAADPGPLLVALSGVRPDEDVFGAILEKASGVGTREFVFDLRGSSDWASTDALRGLAVVDRGEVSGVPYARLRRAADPNTVPVLTVGADVGADRHSAPDQTAVLRARISQLEGELAVRESATTHGSAPRGAVRPGRQRKILILLAAVAVVAGVSIGLAALTDTGYDGALLTALVLLVAAEGAYSWRAQRRLARSLGRTAQAAAASERRDDAVKKSVTELSRRLTEVQRNLRAVTVSTAETARSVTRIPAASGRASLQDVHQNQAIANLYSMLPVDDAVPLMGGWAASPDVVLLLVQELRARRPRLVVECGSGVSTLWLALCTRKYGLDTRIVALDHDARFAQLTRDSLVRHGVEHIAEVRDAPLQPPTGLVNHDTRWYDVAALEGLGDIGLLFVDGPPETTGPRVRYPAVPLLRERFAPQCTVVLDDFIRVSEQEIVRDWQDELPDFTLDRVPLEKGAAVFRRG